MAPTTPHQLPAAGEIARHNEDPEHDLSDACLHLRRAQRELTEIRSIVLGMYGAQRAAGVLA